MLNHNQLVCLDTNEKIYDDGYVLSNPNAKNPAFLRPVYFSNKIKVDDRLPGLYRYSDKLPINRILEGSSSPVTYKSKGLSEYLGLKELYITFNGYWPEKKAYMTTGTFKECEAYSVCARLPKDADKVLTVASAGNTARAFIKVCSDNKIPLVMVVPFKNLNSIWAVKKPDPCVKIIAAAGNSDYFDAINLSTVIAGIPGFINEGGAKNVARRAGMGTTVFSCVEVSEKIPDYYFQAIGSGTGAIAAYESNLQLMESEDYENKKMKLILSQNAPFLPIVEAWNEKSKHIKQMSSEESEKCLKDIIATVLTNRNPPYSIKGGLYDVLNDTDGEVLPVTNGEAIKAMEIFKKTEGIDICPESGVATASLINYIFEKKIDTNKTVMLNITGGGNEMIKRDFNIQPVEPTVTVMHKDFNSEAMSRLLKSIF